MDSAFPCELNDRPENDCERESTEFSAHDIDLSQIGPEDTEPSEKSHDALLREFLLEMMACLTPREEKVVRMRFGFDHGQKHSRNEVASAFGISLERVRQIEAKFLHKCGWHHRRPMKLKDYID